MRKPFLLAVFDQLINPCVDVFCQNESRGVILDLLTLRLVHRQGVVVHETVKHYFAENLKLSNLSGRLTRLPLCHLQKDSLKI